MRYILFTVVVLKNVTELHKKGKKLKLYPNSRYLFASLELTNAYL